jgi:hypothetical protein
MLSRRNKLPFLHSLSSLLIGAAILLLTTILLTSCNHTEKYVRRNRGPQNDNPMAAERYLFAQRTPPRLPGQEKSVLPVERYEAAISHLHQMAVYSTASRSTAKVNQRLRTPWIRPFETREGLILESLISPRSRLSGSISSAAPFAFVVGTSVSDAEVVSSLGTWKPLGPFDSGGRTRSLVINPSEHDSKIMVLATAGGGIWRTATGGESWIPVFDDKPILSVSTLAMSPSNYKIIYAGTGEGFENIDAIRGNGIYVSADNGISWNPITETKDNADFSFVQKIAVSPADSGRVYAATRTGIFVRNSSDGAWVRLNLAGRPLDASKIYGCTDLMIQNKSTGPAGSANYVFVSCGNLGPATVYRTLDDSVPHPLETVLSTHGRTSLAVAPSSPSSVYAMSADAAVEGADVPQGPGLETVFRSDRDGAAQSWQSATNMSVALNRMLLTNVDFASNSKCKFNQADDGKYYDSYLDQGWYDSALAIDPVDPKKVWAGGVDIFRSDDSGTNWGIAGYWRTTQANIGSNIHADVHAIIFHPEYGRTNHTIFVATDGGLFRTDSADGSVGHDACGTAPAGAVKWKSVNAGLSTIQFYAGSILPDGTGYLGGTQDNGTFFGSKTQSAQDQSEKQTWAQVLDGDGGTTLIDPSNTNNVYATYPPSATVQIYKSTTGPNGKYFSAIKNLTGIFSFVTPVAMDPHSSAILWTGGDQVFRTTNAATQWHPASDLLSADNYGSESSGVVTTIAVSPFNPNVVVLGTNYSESQDGLTKIGGWVHSTDVGLTATSQTNWPRSRPRRGWVSNIAFDPADKNVVYVTYSSFNSGVDRGHIFRSKSGGKPPWEPVDGPCVKVNSSAEPCDSDSSSIPDIPVHTIVIDPRDSRRVWVGTDVGVFTSLDRGANWKQENAGFRVPVSMLLVDSQHTFLFAFTHGRGVWRVSLQ